MQQVGEGAVRPPARAGRLLRRTGGGRSDRNRWAYADVKAWPAARQKAGKAVCHVKRGRQCPVAGTLVVETTAYQRE